MANPHHDAHHTAHGTAHHEHGSMDIAVQERTFDGFIRLLTWSAVAAIAVLIFMALANA